MVYDDKIYKQIHGCEMGSPVSTVVANLCMEAIEEVAINSSEVQPKVWKRYVDDSLTNKEASTVLCSVLKHAGSG